MFKYDSLDFEIYASSQEIYEMVLRASIGSQYFELQNLLLGINFPCRVCGSFIPQSYNLLPLIFTGISLMTNIVSFFFDMPNFHLE